jgi:hypothetical protein
MDKPVTIDDIFAIIDRLDQSIEKVSQSVEKASQSIEKVSQERREASAETERMFQETDRKFQEMQKEMHDSAKRLDKQMGDLGLRFGELAEEMVKAGILDKVNALGYQFTDLDERFSLRDTSTGRRIAEIDIVLYDGDAVMAVEVKTKPNAKDVNEHIERLEKMRTYAAGKVWENRKLIAAVAGSVVIKDVREYALKHGIFVISQSGENLKVERPLASVREW